MIDTSPFLIRHLVLVSPISFEYVDKDKKEIQLNLTKQELEESPPFGSQETVSMKFERAYHQHFSWHYYGKYNLTPWAIGPYGVPWPYYESENVIDEHDLVKETNDLMEEARKTRLRCARELRSYSVCAIDDGVDDERGEKFGHIQGFLVNAIKYSIDYFIVDTINYWPSKLVLLKPEFIKEISWSKKEVCFNLSKTIIVESPAYYPSQLTNEYIAIVEEYFSKVEKPITQMAQKVFSQACNAGQKKASFKDWE